MSRPVLEDELRALRQQLTPPPAVSVAPPPPEPPAEAGLERQIKALSEALSALSDDAEGNIKRHPLAAVAAAFLLGFMTGRTTGRL